MAKVDNRTLEVRPGTGQGKTIPIPITALCKLEADGTATDITDAAPLPVVITSAASSTEPIVIANVAVTAGELLNPIGAVRKDAAALSEAVAADDWVGLICDAENRLWVHDDLAVAAMGTLETDIETLELAVEANTTAVGTNSTALGTNSTAIGTNSTAVGTNSTALGTNSTAADSNTTAVGFLEVDITSLETDVETLELAVEGNTSAVGTNTSSLGSNSGALGTNTSALGTLETDISNLETDVETLELAVEANSTAVGTNSTALGTNSTAVGTNSTALGTNSTALGTNSTAADNNTTAVGALETDVTSLETDVETLELAVEANTTAVGTLEADVTSLETDVETLELAVEANTTAVDNNTSAIQEAVADKASTVYDGAGSDGVNNEDLVEYATAAALIAGLAGMTVIDANETNALDIFLGNSTAAQSCTLLVTEYSAAAPTVATQIRATEIKVSTEDSASTVDRNMFGLVTGTEYPVKNPISVSVTPGAYVLISLADDLAGGVWYARYQQHGSL